MMVFLVGPSGVGRTSLGQYAGMQIPHCKFYDLDKLVAERTGRRVSLLLPEVGNDEFLRLCSVEVEILGSECKCQLCLVAVGSGALQSTQTPTWLKTQTTIAVTAPAEEVHRRAPLRSTRDLDEFKKTEYSAQRISIYETANYRLAVDGLEELEAQKRFVELLNTLCVQPTQQYNS